MKDKYFRANGKWAKVSGKAGKYFVAQGWNSNVKANKVEQTNKMQHALIIAENYVNY